MQLDASAIWHGIDRLSEKLGERPSGLAKMSGLNATALVNAKRNIGGKERWPSTQTLARVLNANGITLGEFAALVEGRTEMSQTVPSVPYTRAGAPELWSKEDRMPMLNTRGVSVPQLGDESIYGLEIDSDDLFPFYSAGEVLVVSPERNISVGDRIVLIYEDKPAVVGLVRNINARTVTLYTLPEFNETEVKRMDVLSAHRIIMQI